MNSQLQELKEGLILEQDLSRELKEKRAIILKGRNRAILVGGNSLLKVNTSVGVNDRRFLESEIEKVAKIVLSGYQPDLMMDLSTVLLKKPLYSHIQEIFDGAIGSLPHYLCFNESNGIDANLLLEEIEKQASAGISFFTLHPTPNKALYEEAKKIRLTPVTSRGGSMVIRDMYINRRDENVIADNFDEILKIIKKYDVGLSIGTTFRPATTVDALDAAHSEEILIQKNFIDRAQKSGVMVMMEGLGHATLDKIEKYVKLVKSHIDIPIMPLGPIPTDASVGEDHISSAIGATFMAHFGGADVINSVTRDEHTGGIPDTNSILEGLRAARIAAHSVNISRFPLLDEIDRSIARLRGENYSCVVEGGLFSESSRQRFNMGCSRCGRFCPLIPR